LTIALDATYSFGEELSGVGLYSHEILHGLARAHPETRFDFCYRAHRYWRSRFLDLPRNARRRLLAEPLGPRSADLFHGLNQRLPEMRLRPAVATFHDLFVMTGEYSTPEFRARFTAQARDAARRATAIIAVSAFTRSEVARLLDFDPARIHVVHHGARILPFPRGVPREKVVLNVGAIQTRKNIARLVEAFETLDGDWRLVLAGSFGFGSEEIRRRIAVSRAASRIQVLGYVSPEALADWYCRAAVFVFPSLDEGFGMPLLEAMQAGTPILTSNTSALPEVAGDAALLVNPQDSCALADGLHRMIGDADLRHSLVEKGLARVATFTWEKAVRETWDVYRNLLETA
jgi:glycosyltransferase involved in cell wall biosynthesis